MFQLIQKSKAHLPVKTNFLVKPITIDELKKAIKNIPKRILNRKVFGLFYDAKYKTRIKKDEPEWSKSDKDIRKEKSLNVFKERKKAIYATISKQCL